MTKLKSSLFFFATALFFAIIAFLTLSLTAKHGLPIALHLAALLWSWWVLCLPIAGGGFLLYPLAPLLRYPPFYLFEVAAWFGSLLLNAITITLSPDIYEKTGLTHLLFWFLTNPWPYWIILACASLPMLVGILHHRYRLPSRPLWYHNLRLFLVILSLLCTGYFALHEIIILSNIHA